MAELAPSKLSDEEFHSKLRDGFDHDNNAQYWDIITNADAAAKPAYDLDTLENPADAYADFLETEMKGWQTELPKAGPRETVKAPAHHEELLEAGEIEPLLEATIEPRERTAPRHAAEYHVEDEEKSSQSPESNETITMDDRFANLLMVANHVIERRKTAVETGDKSASLEDFAAFQELYDQYKADGLEQSSLDLIAKLVTSSYELIDAPSAEASQVSEPTEPVIETSSYMLDPNPINTEVRNRPAHPIEAGYHEGLQEKIFSRFHVGDQVGFLVDEDAYEGGWVIKAAEFVEDSDGRGETMNNSKGAYEYTIEKNGNQLRVNAGQLNFESETAPRAETEHGDDVKAEDAEIDDDTQPFEAKSAASVRENETDEVILPEGIKADAKRRERAVTEGKKAFGMNKIRGLWEKWRDPRESHRQAYLVGAAGILAISLGVGGFASQQGGHESEHADLGAVPSSSETFNPNENENEISGVTVQEVTPTETGATIDGQDQAGGADASAEQAPAAKTEYPKGTFTVKLDDGPLKTVNRMGYASDKWFAISESMNRDFPEYFYKTGNDIRYNHVGELPKRVQTAFINRLKGA